MAIDFEETHIGTIRPGDTVQHNGTLMTVCACDLTRHPDGEVALFGDTYRLGHKPVIRAKLRK